MENTEIKNELEKIKTELQENSEQPIFFIGSGISRRYLNLPDWKGLLVKIADRAGIEFRELEKLGDNEKIAQELEYFYFRNETAERIKGKPRRELMRDAIAEIINEYSTPNLGNEQIRGEIEELKRTRPRSIITTNYDTFLENFIFADNCRRYIGSKAILCEEDKNKTGEDISNLYKIHGCVNKPDSIVITKEDYDEFFDKSKYLYAKILTLFYESPLVFMGYSISDRNIKDVLTTIVEMMSAEQIDKFSQQIWILGWNEKTGEDKVSEKEIALLNGKCLKIKCFELYDYRDFFRTINSAVNSRKFGKLKFTVSNDVIELLIKPLYEQQDNLKVVTRELLQNALDACKNIGVNADIVIRIYESGEDLYFEVRDNGIGMNIDDIRRNLLTVGKSSKKDEENGMVGKYGIGILSIFLVGECAEVYTVKEKADLLSFRLHIEGDERQVSWIDRNIDKEIQEYFDDRTSGTLIRIKVKQKEKIADIKGKNALFKVLGLDGYLTNDGNKITILYMGNEYEINKLQTKDYFYSVEDGIYIYRSEWLDAEKSEELDSDTKSIYGQYDTVFFNDMISKAAYNWGRLKLLKNKRIPFTVLDIKDLNKREQEFKTMLSRNSVEITGAIAEDIAKGIYTMEIEKISSLVQSKHEVIRSGEYNIQELRKLLMRECTVFGKNADIFIHNEKLVATNKEYFPHLEIWGYRDWKEEIIKNIDGEKVLYKEAYMHKTSIASEIEQQNIIAISNSYVEEYVYQATGSSNGLRAAALKALLQFLGMDEVKNLERASEVWSYINTRKEEIRKKHLEKSHYGMLWLKENYKKNYSYDFRNKKVIIFNSSTLAPIDNEFARLLNHKIKLDGLDDVLGIV